MAKKAVSGTPLKTPVTPASRAKTLCDWHASHYVKVILDQISGNCKCNSF
jgi:hypothetical protein